MRPRTSPTPVGQRPHETLCIVAILRDETRFIDEWLAYHRLLGADHFVLYDDDPALPLREFVAPHAQYVTVVDWFGRRDYPRRGRNAQTRAYTHAVAGPASAYNWVAFIDGDEFIALRQHADLRSFLAGFADFGAISLQWHYFGHNGFFRDPPGLVTASLTRRAVSPGRMYKSVTRTAAIRNIPSAHHCHLKRGYQRGDPSQNVLRAASDSAKTEVAHINHYMARSFERWMRDAARGDVAYCVDDLPPDDRWKATEQGRLRQFVEVVAKDKNEHVDTFMLKYEPAILEHLRRLRVRREWDASASRDASARR
jgi:hypothetical protein